MERAVPTRQHCLLLGVIQNNLYEKWDTDFPVPSKVFMKNSVFLHFCCPKSYWLDGFHMQSSCSKEAGFKEETEQGGFSLFQGYQYPKSQAPDAVQSAHDDGLSDHVPKSFAPVKTGETEMPWEVKGESSHLVEYKGKLQLVSLLSV